MLSTIIARVRRRDRWPEATATVTSTEVVLEGGFRDDGPPTVRLEFYYRDSNGELESGEVKADSLTSLYNLRVGDTFTLRFDPNTPAKFYCPETNSLFDDFRVGFWLLLVVSAVVMVIITLIRR